MFILFFIGKICQKNVAKSGDSEKKRYKAAEEGCWSLNYVSFYSFYELFSFLLKRFNVLKGSVSPLLTLKANFLCGTKRFIFFIVFKSKLIIYRKDCCNKRYIIK